MNTSQRPHLNRAAASQAVILLALLTLLLGGCASPIGVKRVTTHQAYKQLDANALSSRHPSAKTVSVLHRYGLDSLASCEPDEAVRQLHQEALIAGERDLLFALSEMSYVAAQDIGHSAKAREPRDARDYYLGSAVYAWLFLFGESKGPPPNAFDRRFREACDFYNYGLGLALTERRNTKGAVQLENGMRRLPVGEIQLRLSDANFTPRLTNFDQILLTDQFRVRGLSVRNRSGGVGAPLICVQPVNPNLGIRQTSPATALLRAPDSLDAVASGKSPCTLEIYSSLANDTVSINGARVPLENDFTTYRAYTLNQSYVWAIGRLQFLAPGKSLRSQLILTQPYVPGRVPVVFVHGTFSAPVTWAEMLNTLAADPELRHDYQLWTFVYSSGNPLPISIREFRDALSEMVNKLDPEGKDPALRQMVIIGHSQGALLAHAAAIDTEDRLWRVINTNRLEDLKISEQQRAQLRHLLFLKPLPFVKTVVFISAPHRGSRLSGGFVRRLARRFRSLPATMVSRSEQALQHAKSSSATEFLRGHIPTSLDSMSPKNPLLLTLAEIPVAPGVKAYSIISVKGTGDYREGGDGVVSYKSAHVDYVESEVVVRSSHSCLDKPATIEEVRRILHEELRRLPPGTVKHATSSPIVPTSLILPAMKTEL